MINRIYLRSWLAFLFCCLSAATLRADDKANDLAVIVNKGLKIEDVTSADLQKYFKAERTKTPDGAKLVLVMQDAGRPEREAALKQIFNMSQAEYDNFFVEAVFTGSVSVAPKAFSTPDAVKKYVAATPGAIGYVSGADVDDSVKALKLNGKAPGEDGYKLKLK